MGNALTFNGFQIANGDGGITGDFYALVDNKPQSADKIHFAYNNTAGMDVRQVGTGSSKETAEMFTFELRVNFDTEQAALDWKENIEALQSDYSTFVGDISFSQPRLNGTPQTEKNVEIMDFKTVAPNLNPTLKAFKTKYELSAVITFMKV